MAIIIDPDNLSRFNTIFNTSSEKISTYPVGTTQRNSTVSYLDGWIDSVGTITAIREASVANTFLTDGVVAGDVVCIMTTQNAGHYYVRTGATETVLSLADIDDGTGGAETTNLVITAHTFDGATGVDDGTEQITITAHGYNTGDEVVYEDGGGTPIGGLDDGNHYFIIRVDVNDVKLATTKADAAAGTPIDLTDGIGAAHAIHDRIVLAVFTNGANTGETFAGLATAGDGLGVIADGATLQTYYSYGKEEWRLDSIQNDDLNANYDADEYTDDLIRHEFPFEAITSEQFEVGGGTSHTDWVWFNGYSRKKVRTGGWAVKNTATTTTFEYTGIVTLGNLDSDTQVYYQNADAAAPINFTFLGVVNEPILTFTDGGDDDRAFLKLFARKKARTYAGSEIGDIGVASIQTIVNRFPLAHAIDTAIVADDSNILGIAPFRNGHDVTGTDPIDGAVVITEFTFTDSDATFQTDGIVNNDTLEITSGNEVGFYSIASVGSDTELTILQDTEFTGWPASDGTVIYSLFSFYRVADKTTTPGTVADYTTAGASEGIIETGTPGIGTITDTTGAHFLGSGAGNDATVAGDVLLLTGTVAGNDGQYTVLDSTTTGASDPTTIVVYVDTSDQAFPGSLEGTIDYKVLTNGMYLQNKEVSVTNVAPTTHYIFDDANGTYNGRPTIEKVGGGTWDALTVVGAMIKVTSSENSGENDGRYTVFARETNEIISLINPTTNPDVLTDNTADTAAVITVDLGFERSIGSDSQGSIFAFRWRLFGNGTSLANCFQFVQHQLRQTTDIDPSSNTNRGDITDLLMSFASPTGTGLDMIIDNLDANDINNATFNDHSESARNFPFTAAGNLNFNDNLVSDSGPAKYWLFFLNDNAPGDNLGRDYGTTEAIIVEDATSPAPATIEGNVTGSTIAFTYAYDTNVQRGSSTGGTDADVVLVAIGLITAQFVIANATIGRSVGQTITAVASLERNYSNP